MGTYFDQDVDGPIARPHGEKLEDGGWNFEVENGSVRSSFATTINILKDCWRTSAPPVALWTPSRLGAGVRSTSSNESWSDKSTGEIVNPAWLQFSLPIRWHYDVLRALEYCRSVGDVPDARVDEAIEFAPIQAAARWHLAAGEHASRQGPLCARGRRRSAQPVEHAAGAACPQLVRAVRSLSRGPASRQVLLLFQEKNGPVATVQSDQRFAPRNEWVPGRVLRNPVKC